MVNNKGDVSSSVANALLSLYQLGVARVGMSYAYYSGDSADNIRVSDWIGGPQILSCQYTFMDSALWKNCNSALNATSLRKA